MTKIHTLFSVSFVWEGGIKTKLNATSTDGEFYYAM